MPPHDSHFDLVIFDLDGTLVDSEPLANRVFFEKLQALGLDPGLSETVVAEALTGLSLPSCFKLVRERWGIALPENFRDDLQAETYARFHSDLKPMHGAAELLRASPLPRCVASSSEHEKIRLSLRLTGLQAFFGERIFSAQDVKHGKPAPDLFLHAASALGAKPASCAVIEDSLPGCRAGLAAGMTVFAYRPEPSLADAGLAAAGCHLIRDHAELIPRLGG